jgi:hypothetical protein
VSNGERACASTSERADATDEVPRLSRPPTLTLVLEALVAEAAEASPPGPALLRRLFSG